MEAAAANLLFKQFKLLLKQKNDTDNNEALNMEICDTIQQIYDLSADSYFEFDQLKLIYETAKSIDLGDTNIKVLKSADDYATDDDATSCAISFEDLPLEVQVEAICRIYENDQNFSIDSLSNKTVSELKQFVIFIKKLVPVFKERKQDGVLIWLLAKIRDTLSTATHDMREHVKSLNTICDDHL